MDGESNTQDKIYVSMAGKTLDVKDDIPVINMDNILRELDSMEIIKSTVDMLLTQLDFLKEEIREKNLLIKILNFRNANDGEKININIADENDFLSEAETTSTYNINTSINNNTNIIHNNAREDITVYTNELNNENEETHNDARIKETIDEQIYNYKIKQREKYGISKSICNNFNDRFNTTLDNYESNTLVDHSYVVKSDELNTTISKSPYDNPYCYAKSDRRLENYMSNLQLSDITSSDYNSTIDNQSFNCKKNRVENKIHIWPNNTILITGSSILNGIDEQRLNKKFNVKLRPFPGAYVDDMYDYLAPLLKKKPSVVILQIGSNDSTEKNSSQIFEEITNLKDHIESVLPNVKLYVSCPVLRVDNPKANLTLVNLGKQLQSTFSNVIINDNIDISCLGRKGLHLNPKGSGRLAINFISLIRRL